MAVTNLENCVIYNHKSTENYQDSVNLNLIPNIVLIEVSTLENAPPPAGVLSSNGYWSVDAENFNIGGSVNINSVFPAYKWGSPPYGEEPNDPCTFTVGYPSTNPIGSPLFGAPLATKGKYYTIDDMTGALDDNGNDISSQSALNWDYRVSGIMLCNTYGQIAEGTAEASMIAKNKVRIFVRLKPEFIMPAEDTTLNIDINGFAEWTSLASTPGFTVSDRKLKENIKLTGVSLSGLNIYTFEYIDKKHGEGVYQGVMSDEVPPSAVVKHRDGYDMVDYSKIDVDFKLI